MRPRLRSSAQVILKPRKLYCVQENSCCRFRFPVHPDRLPLLLECKFLPGHNKRGPDRLPLLLECKFFPGHNKRGPDRLPLLLECKFFPGHNKRGPRDSRLCQNTVNNRGRLFSFSKRTERRKKNERYFALRFSFPCAGRTKPQYCKTVLLKSQFDFSRTYTLRQKLGTA